MKRTWMMSLACCVAAVLSGCATEKPSPLSSEPVVVPPPPPVSVPLDERAIAVEPHPATLDETIRIERYELTKTLLRLQKRLSDITPLYREGHPLIVRVKQQIKDVESELSLLERAAKE